MSDQLLQNSEPPALSPVQMRVVVALAQGMSISDAAEFAGVHRVTIHRWLQNPAFDAAVKQTRDQYVENIKHEFQSLTGLAVIKLRKLLDSPKTPPGVVAQVSLSLLNRWHFPKKGWEIAALPNEPASEEEGEDNEQNEEHADATLKAGVASVAIRNKLPQDSN